MKTIMLTKGKSTIVDDFNYDKLNSHNWCFDNGYAKRTEHKKTILMHRYLLGLSNGDGLYADHINRNKLDNRISNLRIVNASQNMSNRTKSKSSKSKYLGVSYEKDRNKWRASVVKNRKKFRSNRFNTEIEAAKWYNEMAIKIHGNHSNLNKF